MKDLKEYEMYEEQYIGDGVYVAFDGYHIWLAANHPGNRVVALEPEVMEALIRYNDHINRLRKEAHAEGDKNV